MARLLVVEGRALARTAWPYRLAAAGHLSDVAGTGGEALERLRGTEYDALLVEGPVPVAGGSDLLHEARSVLQGRVPVIYVSRAAPGPVGYAAGPRASLAELSPPASRADRELCSAIDRALMLRREWLRWRVARRTCAARGPQGVNGLPPTPRVLVVSEDPERRRLYLGLLSVDGFTCESTDGSLEHLERLPDRDYDVILADARVGRLARLQLALGGGGCTQGHTPLVYVGAHLGLTVLPGGTPSPLGPSGWSYPTDWLRAELRRAVAAGLARSDAPADPRPRFVPSSRESPERHRREVRLKALLLRAGQPVAGGVHWCATLGEAVHLVASRLEQQLGTSALRDRLAPFLDRRFVLEPTTPVARWGDPEADRAALEKLAEELHRLPPADRDAPLLALLLAIRPRSALGADRRRLRAVGCSAWSLLLRLPSTVGWLWAFDDGFAVATEPSLPAAHNAAFSRPVEGASSATGAEGGGLTT